MIVLNILIGLVGLGVVVFFHELGHLIAAKSVGIEVEAFSLGWGRKLVGYSWRGTEYRLSVFPVGGYCKMKGERSYAEALERNSDTIPRERGSFFAAAPWRRIVTLLAGPVANVILAIAILSIVWWFGFTIETYENRIVLASDYAVGNAQDTPADRAGLQTGDIVTRINGAPVASYSDIQQAVAQNALTTLRFTVLRNGQTLEIDVVPQLMPETGSGFIGVYPWIPPVIEHVAPGSPAARSGLESGDRIVSVDQVPVAHVWDFRTRLQDADETASVVVERRDTETLIEVPADIALAEEGIAYRTLVIATPDYNFLQAIGRGAAESFRILEVSVRSLGLLFRGVDLTTAVAGPVRISYFIGDVATTGFRIGFATGLRSLFNFLALLSVVLFFMNLLPIPVLDGGQIVLAGVEWMRRKPPRPKTIYRYQLVGTVLIFALLFFALFGDVLFLAGR
jgi:regulator of sigma E protease